MKPIDSHTPDPYRICFFDFETQQNKKIIDKSGKIRYVHEPNFAGINLFVYTYIYILWRFIGLYIVCSECIENDRWNQPLSSNKPCRICGPHRTISFAPFTFWNTKVDKAFLAMDPLDAFVEHLLYNFNKSFMVSSVLSRHGDVKRHHSALQPFHSG